MDTTPQAPRPVSPETADQQRRARWRRLAGTAYPPAPLGRVAESIRASLASPTRIRVQWAENGSLVAC